MNIATDKMHMIFRKDYEDRTLYTTSISKKKQDGTYEKAYIPVQFKKGVELENQTNIYIKNAWITFYKNKENKPVFYIFINEFNTVEEQAKEFQDSSIKTKDNAIESLEVKIEDSDLPF